LARDEVDDPVRMEADGEAIYFTYSGTDPAVLGSMGAALRHERGGQPAVQGIALLVAAEELADRKLADELGKRIYQCLKSWREATDVNVPLVVGVLAPFDPSWPGGVSEAVVFPLDLWRDEGYSEGGVDVTAVPERIRQRVDSLLLDKLARAARESAPPLPDAWEYGEDSARGSNDSWLQPQADWYLWLADLQESRDALCFVLRMAAIGAFGVTTEKPDPGVLLPAHRFKAARGPILLGSCLLATDGDLLLKHMTRELRPNACSWSWDPDAVSRDRWFKVVSVAVAALTAVFAIYCLWVLSEGT